MAGLAKARSGTRNAALIPNRKPDRRDNIERRFKEGVAEALFTPLGIAGSSTLSDQEPLKFFADFSVFAANRLASPDLGPHVHVIPRYRWTSSRDIWIQWGVVQRETRGRGLVRVYLLEEGVGGCYFHSNWNEC